MDEARTRNFTESGTGLIEIQDVPLHVRWRISGAQEYAVGAGSVVDGRRTGLEVSVFFDNLPEESAAVQTLLDKIGAEQARPLELKLGRTTNPGLYFSEIRTDQSGAAIGIMFASAPKQ
ncbi:MAG TPA: hypothetical protein VN699_16250 [Pirellulales bacterium]|nr:hypothetical protein [Pirellulales bacterium]